MADTRSPEERQRDLVGVEQAAILVGVEQIEWQRREQSRLHAEIQRLRAELEECRAGAE